MRRGAPARVTRVSRGSTSPAAALLLLPPDSPLSCLAIHSHTHSHTHLFIISSCPHTLCFSLYSHPSLSTGISPFLATSSPLSHFLILHLPQPLCPSLHTIAQALHLSLRPPRPVQVP